MHQTTRQIASETCIHHSSVYLSGSLTKTPKEAARTGTHYTANCVHYSDQCRSTQTRCGGKYNIHFIEKFLVYLYFTAKNYEDWFMINKVISVITRNTA